MYAQVLAAYGIEHDECTIQPFGTGLINGTWKVEHGSNAYILQRINHQVFKQPWLIASNISNIGAYLQAHYPEYLFVEPVQTLQQQGLVVTPDGEYFRLMPFVAGSCSHDTVTTEQLAYEAARQFGRFARLLSGYPAQELGITLPDFHNLSLRDAQFDAAVKNGNPERIRIAAESIAAARKYRSVTEQFERIRQHPGFKTRVMHHDTKISNVLFDSNGKGLCVIDLDTVMPGYFISDFGDMMRTYLSPANEEEADFSKIAVREDYFRALVNGYLGELKDELSDDERASMVYAGKFMVYMQAIRFLTDYLNNDVYYGAKYESHNLVRAQNQLTLLERINEKEKLLLEAVAIHTRSSRAV